MTHPSLPRRACSLANGRATLPKLQPTRDRLNVERPGCFWPTTNRPRTGRQRTRKNSGPNLQQVLGCVQNLTSYPLFKRQSALTSFVNSTISYNRHQSILFYCTTTKRGLSSPFRRLHGTQGWLWQDNVWMNYQKYHGKYFIINWTCIPPVDTCGTAAEKKEMFLKWFSAWTLI